MDLNFFADPGLVPHPREEIRIQEIVVSPYPDRRRVRLDIRLTPFAPNDRPNLEVAAFKPDGTQVASTTIVETVQHAFGLTLHLRDPEPEGDYTIRVDLYYETLPAQHSVSRTLQLPAHQTDIPIA